MNYELIKEKFNEIRPKVILVFCFLCVFGVGYGVGRGESLVAAPSKRQLQYTTKATEKPTTQNSEKEVKKVGSQTQTSGASSSDCVIKGNISGSKKTYHVAGGAFYERTTPEQCFATETEAQAAGFTKSSR